MERSYRVGKKNVKGNNKGKRYTDTITIKGDNDIYGYLWGVVHEFNKNRCNYIVEWYREVI